MGFLRTSKSFRVAQGFVLILVLLAAASLRFGWIVLLPLTPRTGFLLIFFGITFFVSTLWLRSELNKSYRKSFRRWYEGRAQIIPEVGCVFALKDKVYRADVTRIDLEGIFLWVPGVYNELEKQNQSCLVKLTLSIQNQKKTFDGNLMTLVSAPQQRGYGIGVRFVMLQDDLKKEFYDFIEDLRGYGYL